MHTKGDVLDEQIQQALVADSLIDMTTSGRKSGKPFRKEMAFYWMNDTLYLSGRPGKRDWYANLLAKPEFIIHIKQSAQRDIPARATPITDEDDKRAILTKILARREMSEQLEAWVERSPLVVVELYPAAA